MEFLIFFAICLEYIREKIILTGDAVGDALGLVYVPGVWYHLQCTLTFIL